MAFKKTTQTKVVNEETGTQDMEATLHEARKAMTLDERRAIRTDLGEGRTVMFTPPDDDEWHYHWANDTLASGQSRIRALQNIGYTIVQLGDLPKTYQEVAESKLFSDNVSLSGGLELHAGSDAQNQPMKVVLMRIPQESHRLDKQLREERNLGLESQITGQTDESGLYGDIKLG